MSEAVQVAEANVIPLAERLEPLVMSVGVNRQTVPRYKQSVRIRPLITELFTLLFLLRFEVFENIHHNGRELGGTLRLLRFRGVGVSPMCYIVVRCSANAHDAVIPVDILPFQTEKLSAAVSSVNSENNERSVLCRLVFKQREYLLYLVKRVDFLFLLGSFGNAHFFTGITDRYTVPTT